VSPTKSPAALETHETAESDGQEYNQPADEAVGPSPSRDSGPGAVEAIALTEEQKFALDSAMIDADDPPYWRRMLAWKAGRIEEFRLLRLAGHVPPFGPEHLATLIGPRRPTDRLDTSVHD
jgi:hypothetical protein